MRKVFSILASLCVGLVSGFIVPSGIPEYIDEDAVILAENYATKLEEMKLSTIEPGFVIIPDSGGLTKDEKINIKKVRDVDDNALYENSVDKENNLNERSYVYINEKFKPAREEFNLLKQLENNKPAKNIIILPIERKDTNGKKPLSFFQPSLSEMIVKDGNDNYILSKNECEDCSKGKKTHGLKHRKYDKLKMKNKGIDEELNYIELLKPPFVRTINKNNKIKYDYPSMNDFNSAQHAHYNNKQYPQSKISSTTMQKELNNYRRMLSVQNLVLDKNGIPYKEDNLIFDDNGDQTYKPIEETPEERLDLDRFQKNTYGEQITHEKVNINYDDCNYKNCVEKNKKFQRKANNSKCKCRIKIDTKRNNMQKGRGKGKITSNKSRLIMNLDERRSLEDSDYDNILAKNSNRYGDDELMKTVNKLNYTLQMYH